MVCSCAMLFNCFILFYSCVNETTLFSFLRSLLHENGRLLCFLKIFLEKKARWLNDKTIIELGHRKISWFVSVSQINYLPQPSASENNNIDLLASDKSQYFAQPHPIIANCSPLKKLFCLNRRCFQLYGIFVGMFAVASGDKFWTWFLFSRCIWYLVLNMCLLERACNKLCPILNSTLSFSLNYPDYQQPVSQTS